MNYYIQGDADNADKISAAFEKLGYDTSMHLFNAKSVLYFTFDGDIRATTNGLFITFIKSRSDYQELKLPIEPKFKVVDWYLCTKDFLGKGVRFDKGKTYHCGKDDCLQQFDKGAHIAIVPQLYNHFKLWTIADANDGDVLATDNGWTCIFQSFDGCGFSSHCFMDSQRWFCEFGSEVHTPDSRINGKIHPATKEQRDLLFTKMKEAGYEWDAEKKELKKIQHYDIARFYAGMPVLVRDSDNSEWKYVAFSHYREEGTFCACGSYWYQCIPFNEETKHLLGTTDMPSEEFINW